jgi:excisionase family DNA binding protein
MTKSTPAPEETILVGRPGAAHLLSVSVRTVDNLVQQKILKARRVRGRVLFLRADLERFARQA